MKDNFQIIFGGLVALLIMASITVMTASLGYQINASSHIEAINMLRPKASIMERSKDPEHGRNINYWNNHISVMRSENQQWPINIIVPDAWDSVDYIRLPAL